MLFLRNGRNRGGKDEDGEQASGSAHQRLSTGVSRIRGWRRIFRWDGTFSRQDLSFDKEQNIYICPTGKILTTTGKLVNDGYALLYKTRDCRSCLLKGAVLSKKPSAQNSCKARLGDWRGSDDELCEPAAAKPPMPRAHRRAFATSENGPPTSFGSSWTVGSLPPRSG